MTTEEKSIDEVVKLGLGEGILWEIQKIGSENLKLVAKSNTRASAGSAQDLVQVQQELSEGHKKDKESVPPKIVEEILVSKVKKPELKVCIKKT